MPEGEREILDGNNGPVLVTKVAGSFYAVDATCPHLGLPMKKGKIATEDGKPTLTCNFHNSCFELESGKCTQWVTGALGFKSGILGSVMGKVGGQKQDIKAYKVTVQEDGSLLIE
jgi:nitrite reductase/ring-hydroxylating ferredoxin subunit